MSHFALIPCNLVLLLRWVVAAGSDKGENNGAPVVALFVSVTATANLSFANPTLVH